MKKKSNKSNKKFEYQNDVKKLLIILGIILVVFIVAYLIISIFITKEIGIFKKEEKTVEKSTIQYTEILASETFKIKNDTYYVLFSDSENPYYDVYKNIISTLSNKKVYIVDLNNTLNKKYIAEESNINAQGIQDLKVKNHTLIKIENGNNTLYIEDKNEILSTLKK